MEVKISEPHRERLIKHKKQLQTQKDRVEMWKEMSWRKVEDLKIVRKWGDIHSNKIQLVMEIKNSIQSREGNEKNERERKTLKAGE